MKKRKIIKSILLLYLVYAFVTAVIVYKIDVERVQPFEYDTTLFQQQSEQTTYGYLIVDGEYAFNTRLALINNAQSTIDVAYHSILSGEVRSIFYGALLEAANRGVGIRFITDGLVSTQIFSRHPFNALIAHPNITISLYEPVNILVPYTIQNRLHDKLLVIDNRYGMIGGRNIGDRYFFDEDTKAFDRDVLIFGNDEHQTIIDMKTYINDLITSRYSRIKTHPATRRIKRTQENLIYTYQIYRDSIDDFSNILDDINRDAIEIKRASFIHNPITRGNKYPVIFETLVNVAQDYDDIFIQSPYIVLSRHILNRMPDYNDKNLTLLTNTISHNPNPFAASGYIRYRSLYAKHANLYEHQSIHSIHAKTIMMGDEISVIGSFNIDHRSFFLSTESVMVIYSQAFNSVLQVNIEELLDNSLLVKEDGSYQDGDVESVDNRTVRRALIRFMSYLSSLFDEML